MMCFRIKRADGKKRQQRAHSALVAIILYMQSTYKLGCAAYAISIQSPSFALADVLRRVAAEHVALMHTHTHTASSGV